jgi:hypothetical protein
VKRRSLATNGPRTHVCGCRREYARHTLRLAHPNKVATVRSRIRCNGMSCTPCRSGALGG